MYEKKMNQFKEELAKERQKNTQLELKLDEVKKSPKREGESQAQSQQKIQNAKKQTKLFESYEKQITLLNKEIDRLKGLLLKGGKQTSHLSMEELREGISTELEESRVTEDLRDAIRNFKLEQLEEIRELKKFVEVLYALVAQRRGLFVDARILAKIRGNKFESIVDEVYSIFHTIC